MFYLKNHFSLTIFSILFLDFFSLFWNEKGKIEMRRLKRVTWLFFRSKGEKHYFIFSKGEKLYSDRNLIIVETHRENREFRCSKNFRAEYSKEKMSAKKKRRKSIGTRIIKNSSKCQEKSMTHRNFVMK